MLNALCNHKFFDGLTEEHNDVVRRIARPVRFNDGEVLFHQGDMADAAFFIASGTVRVRARVPGGAEVEVAELKDGDMVGELALIENHRRSARAFAEGSVEALRIDSRDLSALCAHYHPASLLLMHRLALTVARRIRDTAVYSALSLTAPEPVPAEHVYIERNSTFDIRPFLPNLDLFRSFSQHDIEEFNSMCQPFSMSRGTLLNDIGSSPLSIWLVVRGSVESRISVGGHLSRAAVLGPGRLAGETGWLLEGDTPFAAIALTSCTVLELPVTRRAALLSPESHLSFCFFQGLLRNMMKRLGSQTRDFARKEQIRLTGTSRHKRKVE